MLVLAAGGAVAAAARWLRRNPARIETGLKGVYTEYYLEVREAFQAEEEVPIGQRPTTLASVDTRYQRFVVEKLDPLLSRTRRDQLAEISGGHDLVEITEDERQLNRYIGAALVSMGSAVFSIVYPPALIVVVGTAIYSTMRIFRNGYYAIVHERKLRMDVMGSLYFVGAFAGGFFVAGSFGLVAYYLSEKLVLITQDRSQRSLIKVFGQQPRTVWRVEGNVEIEVPIETIQAGDRVVIQAGQVIPVDGVIVDGIATVDQHILTGESQPVEKGVGDPVLTSTLMMGGRVEVRVEKTGEETAAAQIGVILNNTASYQATIVSKGEQVADRSVPPTMALALVALPLSGYRYAVTILGSAIGLNIKLTAPIAMLNFLNVAANRGILVKDGRSLELLKDIDTVVFDKTGTLTMEQPRISAVHVCSDLDADEVLVYAAAAEHRQTHPIARAILDAARDRGLGLPPVDNAHYEMGYGLRVRLDDRLVRVGSRRYMALEDIDVPGAIDELVDAVQGRGHSLVMVAVDESLVGAIELEPTLRAEVLDVVRELRKRGLDLCIISGDQEGPTRQMAAALGIPRYFANTLPEEKANLVTELQSEGRSVCFVGDGINDSISLKKANVSVSLRGASTAATDTAQVVLMGEGLHQLPFLFELAEEFDGNMRAGFGIAVGQGVVVIGGALVSLVGIVTGTLIWTVGLVVGLGIAHLPLHRHQALGPGTRRALPPGGPPGAPHTSVALELPAAVES